MKTARFSIRDLKKAYPDDDACLEWLVEFLYPGGIECAKCGKVTKHHRIKKRKLYSCQSCGHHVCPTAGTVFHKSSTPLTLWFEAIFLMASTRCGVSAKQLERQLGVTYKTAWRMFKQIRSMLDEGTEPPLMGRVQIDDSYHGGKEANKHVGKRTKSNVGGRGKTIILGMAEEDGRIMTTLISNTDRKTMLREITARVHGYATIYTDGHTGFDYLPFYYEHHRVQHDIEEYVRGNVTTNMIEGFWGNFKTGTRGAYKHISPKHLQSYVNEYTFRYNRRKSEVPMFQHFVAQVKQLDWWVPYSDRVQS